MKKSNSPQCCSSPGATDGSPTPDAAFTRIELVTVIAVLVFWAMLLTPVLARSRVIDHAFQCQNNLRQLINGWLLFAADNGGSLPESVYWVAGSLTPGGSDRDNTNVVLIQESRLWPYVKNLSTFKCPADQSYGVYAGIGRLPRTRSYSMSQAIGTHSYSAGGWLPSPPWRVYGKLSDITAPPPAQFWVFLDEHPDAVNDAGFAVSMDQQGINATWVDIPGHYHEGACGFSFADGHTEMHKWKDERTIALFPVTYNKVAAFLTKVPNSPDIAWVQARTSSK